MRSIELHPKGKGPKIVRNDHRDGLLSEFLTIDLEDALTARMGIDRAWIEARRQYNAVPKRPVREVPVPNAPNIEIPIGAIIADDIYAQATDTLFTASPLVTVRACAEEYVEPAKAMQVWVDWLVANDIGLVASLNTAILDCAQLGTGFLYIPYIEDTKKTKVYDVTYRHAQIFAISPEDVILPPGARDDLQRTRFIGVRFWLTKSELEERARIRKWDIAGVQPTAKIDMVRLAHEHKSGMKTGGQLWRLLYEIVEVYCYFDYDGDGIDEDLLVVFDRNSRKIIKVEYNPYDTRPIEVMRYQLRPHLPYGLGIMEMVQPFQEEVTEIHCATVLNIFLANARMWIAAKSAFPESVEIHPGKVLHAEGGVDDVRKAIAELKMSEVYPSAFQSQAMGMQLAERRIGTTGQSAAMSKGGSRVPGVTMLSMLQQVNRRFAPAFKDIREASGRSVVQAVWRISERVKAGDQKAIQGIVDVVGQTNADLIMVLLKLKDFTHAVAVEFTASSASVNKEADRQNAMVLNNMLGQYYQQAVAITTQAADPNTPPAVRELLIDLAKKGTELMDRTVRTFEMIRDPKAFLVKPDIIETAVADAEAQSEAITQAQAMATAMQGMSAQAGLPTGGQTDETGALVPDLPEPTPGFSGVA